MCALVGDKNDFGIEYAVQSNDKYVMGNIRLWFKGVYVGSYSDVNILTSILFVLEGVNPDLIDGKSFEGMSPEQIYGVIKSDDNYDGDKYYFTPGEAFDDFSVVVYAVDDKLNFIWRLHDEPYFSHPDYPLGIQSAQISLDEYRQVIMDFKKKITRNVD